MFTAIGFHAVSITKNELGLTKLGDLTHLTDSKLSKFRQTIFELLPGEFALVIFHWEQRTALVLIW